MGLNRPRAKPHDTPPSGDESCGCAGEKDMGWECRLERVDVSPTACIDPDQDEEEEGEAPERRAPIAEEG